MSEGGKRKAAVDPKEAGAVPGCLGSSALFLSTSRDPTCAELRRLWRMFSAPLRSDVSGVLVLSAWTPLLVSVTGTGGNFSKTGAEGGSRSPEADPDPTPGGPRGDTGPLEGEVQLRSEIETQN